MPKQAEAFKVKIIEVQGRLDFEDAQTLKNLIRDNLQLGTVHVILNFEKLQSIAFASISVLVGIAMRLREYRGDIKIASIKLELRNIFHRAGAAETFNFYQTVDEALAQFQKEKI